MWMSSGAAWCLVSQSHVCELKKLDAQATSKNKSCLVSPKGVLEFKISRPKQLFKICLRLVDLNYYLNIAYMMLKTN